MGRPRKISEELVKQAQLAVSTSRDATELRCAQAVLFPAISGTTLEQKAALIRVSRASVPRLQARFRQGKKAGREILGEYTSAANALKSHPETAYPGKKIYEPERRH